MHVARALAQWSTSVSWDDASPADRQIVLNALVDTVGVTLAGTQEAAAEDVLEFARRLSLTGDDASLWGSASRSTAGGAALVNGTLGHLLDFDDMHYLIHGHPSTVLVPALVAACEANRRSGERLLTGYLAGIGAMAATSLIFGPDHYTVGWHSTGTTGAIGAAVAVATALDLPLEQRVVAIDAAVSMASGVRVNFGTVLKPLHAGLAARAGIEAVAFAQTGFVVETDALGGRLGAVHVYGDGTWPRDFADPMGAFLEAAQNGLHQIGVKPYPSCTGGHWAIEAALNARADAGAHASGDIQRIEATVPLGAKVALLYDDPQTGLEAKFSLPYAVATSAVRGLPVPAHFTDDAVLDDEVRAVMSKITVVEDDAMGDLSTAHEGRYAEVRIHLTDGRTGHSRVDEAKGSWHRPLSVEDVDAKFSGCAAPVLGEVTSTDLLARLRSVATCADVRELISEVGG